MKVDQLSGTVPKLTGIVRVGTKVTVKPGAWTPGATLSYQWLRNGKEIPGATQKSHTSRARDLGNTLSVRVTGAKAGYTPLSKTSAAVEVQAGRLWGSTPVIKGSAKVGSKIAAVPRKWASGAQLTYQWLRDGKAIRGATTKSYVPQAADEGSRLSVRVTGTKPGYAPLTKVSSTTRVKG